MELSKLEVAKRDQIGTNAVRQMRHQGRVPGVLYGDKSEPLSFSADEKILTELLAAPGQFVEVEFEGQVQTSIIQEVQYDTWGQKVLHVDFVRVDANKPVEVAVPLNVFGTPKGASVGGALQKHHAEVRIQCIPRLIPHKVDINMKALGIGDTIQVKDLPLPSEATVVGGGDQLVCEVINTRAAAAEEADGDGEDGES